MKPLSLRRLLIFFLCVFYALLLSCCSENGSQETIHPVIAELMATLPKSDAEPLPDEVISESDICKIYRKNGRCYVDYKAGNERVNLRDEGSCILPSHEIWCKSIESLHQWLTSAKSLENAETVKYAFPLDEKYGFCLPDPEQLYTIQVPDQYEPFNVTVFGNSYEVTYRSKEEMENGIFDVISMTFMDEDAFVEKLTWYHRRQFDKASFDVFENWGDHNATAYESETPSGRFRYVEYVLQTKDRVVFIEEQYRITSEGNSPVSEERPLDIIIFGCENGIYFSLRLSNKDPSRLPEVLQFIEIVKFNDTTN